MLQLSQRLVCPRMDAQYIHKWPFAPFRTITRSTNRPHVTQRMQTTDGNRFHMINFEPDATTHPTFIAPIFDFSHPLISGERNRSSIPPTRSPRLTTKPNSLTIIWISTIFTSSLINSFTKTRIISIPRSSIFTITLSLLLTIFRIVSISFTSTFPFTLTLFAINRVISTMFTTKSILSITSSCTAAFATALINQFAISDTILPLSIACRLARTLRVSIGHSFIPRLLRRIP